MLIIMKLRNFEEALIRGNLIKDLSNIISTEGTIGTLTSTVGAIATLTGTTATYGSVIGTTKLVVPATAYTGSAPDAQAIYATAAYIFVGEGGTWKSAALT